MDESDNNEDETICIRKLCPIRPLKMKLLKETSLLDFGIFFIRKLVANTRKMDDLKFKNTIIFTGEELLLNENLPEFLTVCISLNNEIN